MKDKIESARARLPAKARDIIGDVPIEYIDERHPSGRLILGRFLRYPDRITVYAAPWYWFGLHVVPTVVHELGHALDYATGRRSGSEAFLEARRKDWSDLREYEIRSKPKEAFADTCVALWGPWWSRWYLGNRPNLKSFVLKVLSTYSETFQVRPL